MTRLTRRFDPDADEFPDEPDEENALPDNSPVETETPTQPLPELAPDDFIFCPECNGSMIWARTALVIESESAGGFFRHNSPCQALVCVDCGFMKLYAADPQKLL